MHKIVWLEAMQFKAGGRNTLLTEQSTLIPHVSKKTIY